MFSVKTKEHIRRWAEIYLVKLGALLLVMGALAAAVVLVARRTRVVQITDTDGAKAVIITAARNMETVFAQAGVDMAGEHDALERARTAQGQSYHIRRAFPVAVTADGRTNIIMTTVDTVGEVLDQLNITFDEDDELSHKLTDAATEDMEITLQRIEYREYTQEEVVPVETEYLETSLYYRKRFQNITRHVRTGTEGLDSVTYRERYVDGVLESVEEIGRETVEEMVTTVIKCYGEKAPVSHFVGPEIVDGKPTTGIAATYTGRRATGYSASATAKGASGRRLTYGTVAVNPNIIPYGSLMYITSDSGDFVYGYAYAADTGTAMMTGHAFIDLYYETYDESVKNEVISVTVYVLDKATAALYKEQNDAILAADTIPGM